MSTLPAPLSWEKQEPLAAKAVGSGLIALCICCLTVIGFVAATDRCLHWFLLPVVCCGLLIGMDAVDWVRGRLDLYDPAGVLGVLGFHFFFLAPLLHIAWDHWTFPEVPRPDNWRYWVGIMAILNAFGLVTYRLGRRFAWRWTPFQEDLGHWTLRPWSFYGVTAIALAATGLLQIWAYASYGGLAGYIEESTSTWHRFESMQGEGWIYMFSESFPILAMMFYAACALRKESYRSWGVISVVLVAFFVLAMLFGGLRGSRSNTLWAMFWAVGIVHLWLRPVPRRVVLICGIFGLLFTYIYGFYKDVGLDAFEAFQGDEARQSLETKTGRTIEDMLLADFARTDVQAYIFYRVTALDSDYQLGWGRSYLGGMSLLVPRTLWPNRPPTKIKEGTELFDGRGSFIPILWQSSRVYGLAGEAMLNFGPLAVPPAFLAFGFFVGWLQRLLKRLKPLDTRLLIAPFLINMGFIILINDSDNIVFALVKSLAVPLAILLVCSDRRNTEPDRNPDPGLRRSARLATDRS